MVVHNHAFSLREHQLQAMIQGFTPGYDDAELDEIEEEVALPPCAGLGYKHGGGSCS
jgi:hypothetical protein